MPTRAFKSAKTSIGYCGKSAQPSYSRVYTLVGKSLLGAAPRVEKPKLGRLRPGKRASQPPLGFIELPSSTKFIGSELGVPLGSNAIISSEAMLAPCE